MSNANEIKLVVTKIVMPDDEYWALVNVETGEKVAPWSDADTPEDVIIAISLGIQS